MAETIPVPRKPTEAVVRYWIGECVRLRQELREQREGWDQIWREDRAENEALKSRVSWLESENAALQVNVMLAEEAAALATQQLSEIHAPPSYGETVGLGDTTTPRPKFLRRLCRPLGICPTCDGFGRRCEDACYMCDGTGTVVLSPQCTTAGCACQGRLTGHYAT